MSALNVTTERTYYDGQMPTEESVTTSGNTTLTRNFVGARGIEAMFLTQGGTTNTSYPLYDVHGNMVATVAKGSSGTSWTIQDERSYDVWGSVRSGAATGGPRGRYCANLGHVQDDESGLVYMRARYYEPGSGRFISEDPALDGGNWYQYAANIPNQNVDPTGHSWDDPLHWIRQIMYAVTSSTSDINHPNLSHEYRIRAIERMIADLDVMIGDQKALARQWNDDAQAIENYAANPFLDARERTRAIEMARTFRAISVKHRAIMVAAIVARAQLKLVLAIMEMEL